MNLIYKGYFMLPNFSKYGIPGRVVNRLLLKLMKPCFDNYVPRYLKRTSTLAGSGINTELRSEKYIVSLTSFPARINDVWVSIETIMRQTFKPDAIVLWLAEEQFPDRKLPQSLVDLQERGLTVRYCENLRSHTKYFFALKEYSDANVITVDDDCYYPKETLENLVKLHHAFPQEICANRAHKITFKNGRIRPYRKWKHNCKEYVKPNHLLVATGVGGVLYPPNSLNDTVFDKDTFREICMYADDLWLKVNTDLKGTQVVTNKKYNKDLVTVCKTQSSNLVSQNSFGGGNDGQLAKVLEFFRFNYTEERRVVGDNIKSYGS